MPARPVAAKNLLTYIALMNMPPFHIWAPTEIARLRRQADELEAALALYVKSTSATPIAGASAPHQADARPRGRQRGSKYEPLFDAFEKTGRVLSLDEMFNIANEMNLRLDRSNLRSQVFAQKSAGRAHPEGSGYRWGNLEKLTAPPEEGGAA